MASAPRPRARHALFCLAAVLVAQVFCTWGFWRFLDLHPADECQDMLAARMLLDGRPDPMRLLVWNGPLTVLYASLLPVVPAHLAQDVVLATAALAATVALFLALAHGAPLLPATALTLGFATSGFLVGGHRSVYLLAAALSFAGLGMLERGRREAGTVLLLVAALTRTEALLWAGGGALALLFLRRERRCGTLLLAGVFLILLVQTTTRAGRERSWLAFAQHYAMGRVARGETDLPRTASLRAFDRPWVLVAEDFGNAGSPVEAAVRAPGRVLAHVAANAAELPGVLLGTLAPFPAQPAAGRIVASLVLAVAALGARGAFRRRREQRVRTAFLAASPLLLVPSLLFAPKAGYLVLAVLPIGWLVLEALRPLAGRAPSPAWRPALASALLLVVLAVPRPVDRTPRSSLPWRELCAAVRALGAPTVYSPRGPSAIEQVLPAGVRVRTGSPDAAWPRDASAVVHAEDLVAANVGALVPEERDRVLSLLRSSRWSPARRVGGVLVLERRP